MGRRGYGHAAMWEWIRQDPLEYTVPRTRPRTNRLGLIEAYRRRAYWSCKAPVSLGRTLVLACLNSGWRPRELRLTADMIALARYQIARDQLYRFLSGITQPGGTALFHRLLKIMPDKQPVNHKSFKRE